MKQTTINNLHFAIIAVLFMAALGLMAFAVTSESLLEAFAEGGMGIALGLISVGLYQKYQIEETLPRDILER